MKRVICILMACCLLIVLLLIISFVLWNEKKALARENDKLLYDRASMTQLLATQHTEDIKGAQLLLDVLHAMIVVESSWRVCVVSETGDIGLLQFNDQFLPYYTAKYWIKLNIEFDPCNPAHALYLATHKVLSAIHAFSGDVEKAVRSYNVGVTGARQGRGSEYLAKVEAVYQRVHDSGVGGVRVLVTRGSHSKY